MTTKRSPWYRLTHLREDPRPIPTLARRRLAVVLISALQVAMVALIVLVSPLFLGIAVVTGLLNIWFGWFATRNMIATRGLAPLDEWQRDQVMRAYRSAYWIISGVLLVAGIVLANLNLNLGVELPPLDFGRLAAALFVLGIYLVPWVPVAVLAWRLPDEEVETAEGVPAHP
jgi:hypothetical protein